MFCVLIFTVQLGCGLQPLRLGTVLMLRRGLYTLRLGITRVAMISLSSGILTLFSDDLSLVIFRHVYRNPSKVFKTLWLTETGFEIL